MKRNIQCPNLPKEIYVGWFGDKGDQWLSANQTGEDALLSADENKVICGRYVLKEEVIITRNTEIQVKRKL